MEEFPFDFLSLGRLLRDGFPTLGREDIPPLIDFIEEELLTERQAG